MSNRKPNQRTYTANIVGATFGTASTGNEQIAIQCEITEGPDDLTTIAYLGTFTDKSFEYTEKAMRACGWEGNDLIDFKRQADAGQLGPVEIVVYDDTYDGETRPKILFINKPGGGRFKFKEGSELDGAGLQAFSARMKAAFAAGASGRPASRSSGGNGGGQRRPSNGGDSHPNAPGNDRGGTGGGYSPDDDLPFSSASIEAEPSPIARCLRSRF
jgi:hypothetical protein